MSTGAGVLGAIAFLFVVLIMVVFSRPTKLDKVTTKPTTGGWHADPLGRFDSRYYDGRQWTQHVGRVNADGTKQQFEDPV